MQRALAFPGGDLLSLSLILTYLLSVAFPLWVCILFAIVVMIERMLLHQQRTENDGVRAIRGYRFGSIFIVVSLDPH